MNKRMLSMIAALAVAVGAFGTAGARTSPASMGTHITPGGPMPIYNNANGTMTSTGTGDWQMPLAMDNPGPKTASVWARSPAPGAFWQLRCANANVTVISISIVININIGAPYVQRMANAVMMGGNGYCWMAAHMIPGASIAHATWNE